MNLTGPRMCRGRIRGRFRTITPIRSILVRSPQVGWLSVRTAAAIAMTVLVVGLLAAPITAQEIVDTVPITSYVTSVPTGENGSSRSIQVLIRVPLSLVDRTVFRTAENRIVLPVPEDALQAALTTVRDAIGFTADGTALQPFAAGGRLSLPSDRSFDTFETAVAHMRRAPVAGDADVFAGQGFFDARFEFHAGDRAQSHDRPSDAQSGTQRPVLVLRAAFQSEPPRIPQLVVHYRPFDGDARSYVLAGGNGRLTLNPSVLQTAGDFLLRGIRLAGSTPVLLFFLLGLCGLIAGVRRAGEALILLTVYVAGHSVALMAMNWAASPGPWFTALAATLAAGSVLAIALEIVLVIPTGGSERWPVVLAYGGAQGLAFASGLLPDLQFAGPHSLVALLTFDVGIAIGEVAALIVVTAIVPWVASLIGGVRRFNVLLAVILGHFAWHRLAADGSALWQSDWPPMAATVLLLARAIAITLIAVGLARVIGRRRARSPSRAVTP